MKNEYHIPIELEGKTAVEFLLQETSAEGLSRQKIKQAMQKGCVWLETNDAQGKTYIQRIRRAKKILQQGDVLHCYYNTDVLNSESSKASLISDEGNYSIWHKPSGMLSQGSKWGDHCTIYRWAEKHLKPERPAFIVHRLDRAASGLIILAHKKQVSAQFSKLFQDNDIEKHYWVKVEGDFNQQLKNNESKKVISTPIDGKVALSHVSILEFDAEKNISLLDVRIETGRKHQIRKHLSNLGFPVVGDRLYGSGQSLIDLQLVAKTLAFICPIKNQKKTFKLDE